MNSFPPELHSYICDLACSTDDGFTARSLSVVSRYFSAIVRPYQYHSICICNPSQIQSLSKKLSNTASHLRRVRHLYVSDSFHEGSAQECDVGGCQRKLANAIISILTLAAPTLETLTFITTSPHTSTSLIARVFRTHFPHLHELTVSGHYPFPSTYLSGCCFPSLERLHLHGNRNPHGLLSLGGLEAAMPNLTHLRVSGLIMAVSFSQELQQACLALLTDLDKDDGNAARMDLVVAKLPEKLQHLLVQCGPDLSLGSTDNGPHYHNAGARLKDETMTRNLGALAGFRDGIGERGGQLRFSLLPRGRSTTNTISSSLSSSSEFRVQWVDRLRGKEGCWT